MYKYGLGMSTACNQADSWQQLNYHTLLATCNPLSGHAKLEMILKICNFKKEVGIKVKVLCKQVRDHIVWKQVEDTAQGLL